MNGSGLTDVPLRRRVNKLFMDCLDEVQQDQAAALIWLKRHVEPDICDTILSDKNFSGIQTIIVNLFHINPTLNIFIKINVITQICSNTAFQVCIINLMITYL